MEANLPADTEGCFVQGCQFNRFLLGFLKKSGVFFSRFQQLIAALFQFEQGTYSRTQLEALDRLNQKVVCARIERLNFIIIIASTGYENNRNKPKRFVGANPSSKFEAIETGHSQIGKNQVGAALAHLL